MRCCVPGCKSGYSNILLKGRHFFAPPKSEELLSKWSVAIRKEIKRNHRICAYHFTDSSINKSDLFLIAGRQVVIPKLRWSLKPDAIPCVFPNKMNASTVVDKSTDDGTRSSGEVLSPEPSANLIPEVAMKEEPLYNEGGHGDGDAEETEGCDGFSKGFATVYIKQEVHGVNTDDDEEDLPSMALDPIKGTNGAGCGMVKQEAADGDLHGEISTMGANLSAGESILPNEAETFVMDGLKKQEQDSLNLEPEVMIAVGDESGDQDFNCCVTGSTVAAQVPPETCVPPVVDAQRRTRAATGAVTYIPPPFDLPADAIDPDTPCETCGGRCAPRACENVMTTGAGQTMYACGLCENRWFKLLKSLKIHLKMHAGLYVCEVCGKAVNNNCQLREHMRSHTKEKPFVCSDCGKAFSYSCKLKEHKRTHTGELPYACSFCKLRFSRSDRLRRHTRQHTGELIPCVVCLKTFTCTSSLREHMAMHTGHRPFSCERCDKRFTKANKLKIHMRSHTGEKPYNCPQCDKCYSSSDKLKKHLTTHDSRKYGCEFCEEKFRKSGELKAHLRKLHSKIGERPYVCKVCNSTYKLRTHLAAHMRAHSRYQCDVCDESFAELHDLRAHTNGHTSGEKPFLCKTCGESFVHHELLERHTARWHARTGPRAACDLCSATFGQEAYLKRHRRKHFGDVLHPCALCGGEFNSPKSVAHHLRQHHARPSHVCTICRCSFKDSGELSEHMRVHHEGMTMYTCEVCGRVFVREARLRRHMQIAHREEVPGDDSDSLDGDSVIDRSDYKYDPSLNSRTCESFASVNCEVVMGDEDVRLIGDEIVSCSVDHSGSESALDLTQNRVNVKVNSDGGVVVNGVRSSLLDDCRSGAMSIDCSISGAVD